MPMEPLIAHALPPARSFTGREAHLRALHEFWTEGHGVLSLVGIGGAGKTALIERFLSTMPEEDRPEGLLVWSFYDDPDTNSFLQSAVRYFSGSDAVAAKGAGWFHLLRDALDRPERYLLVLDGLERVQREQTDASGIYGQLEDPLLRGLLMRLAQESGGAKALITSRFPVSDLERWLGKGYEVLDVDMLEEDAARRLLEVHGVRGKTEAVKRLLDGYGRHALTVDLLGGYCRRCLDGDLAGVPPFSDDDDHAPLVARRLRSVLRMFEEGLPPIERDLLSRLCVFRFGVTEDSLISIFTDEAGAQIGGSLEGKDAELLKGALGKLEEVHLAHRENNGRFVVHPAVRDHFYSIFRDSRAFHGVISRHLMSLSGRPGVGLPSEKPALDMLEELVYHAIKAGNVDEALEIYGYRLGGNSHLNVELGEYARTYRILKAFPECPDGTGMYHCLRAFGRYDEALEWRPRNRYILLATGRLSQLRDDASPICRQSVRFLRGEEAYVPDKTPDYAIPASMMHLMRGDLGAARRFAEEEVRSGLFMDDVERNRLMLAEILRRKGETERSRQLLEEASEWCLRAGSQEHLGLFHLVRSRILLLDQEWDRASAAAREGMQVCDEAGIDLFKAVLLEVDGRARLGAGDLEAARTRAAEALALSEVPEMGFVWGAIGALRLEAEILWRESRTSDAAIALEGAVKRQRRAGDLTLAETERTLARLRLA
jgi:hypothetical protein